MARFGKTGKWNIFWVVLCCALGKAVCHFRPHVLPSSLTALRERSSPRQDDQNDFAATLDRPPLVPRGANIFRSEESDAERYRRAAERGDATAQYNLGVCYHNGQGVPQSYEEAAKWYRKAAAQGDANAQFNLGVSYDNGEGVPQSDTEAAKWYRKAAEQGHEKAKIYLAEILEKEQDASLSDEIDAALGVDEPPPTDLAVDLEEQCKRIILKLRARLNELEEERNRQIAAYQAKLFAHFDIQCSVAQASGDQGAYEQWSFRKTRFKRLKDFDAWTRIIDGCQHNRSIRHGDMLFFQVDFEGLSALDLEALLQPSIREAYQDAIVESELLQREASRAGEFEKMMDFQRLSQKVLPVDQRASEKRLIRGESSR